MSVLRSFIPFQIVLALSLLRFAGGPAAYAKQAVTVHELGPNIMVFSTATGNVVASVGKDGVLLVGTPSVASTSQISHVLAARTRSPVRYVVIAPTDPSHSEGDAGWGRRGAFVAMQENALGRLGGHVMGATRPLPSRFIQLGVDRPRISFSDVLSFDINGEAIHVVHQPAAYSDADSIVHFHVANLVYLGEVFPGDGYPEIDVAQKGNLEGLIKILSSWTDSSLRVVPARGNVTDGAAVKAFLDMVTTVRDRVRHLIDAGQTEQQVLAAQPTKDFDAQWGHGRIPPRTFIHEIYLSLASGVAPKSK